MAVAGVDLKVSRGEVLLLMVPSGSGKTTLLTMAGALLSPTSGQIRIGGEAVAHLSQRSLTLVRRHKVGFIFQSFNLLASLTALENVEIALNLAGIKGTVARSRALQLLTEFGLERRLAARPEQLSGGEKQRVSIARALVNDPLLRVYTKVDSYRRNAYHFYSGVWSATGCCGNSKGILASYEQQNNPSTQSKTPSCQVPPDCNGPVQVQAR